MPVSLTLTRRGAYTNLDFVEGEVKLNIPSSESIDNITVKIEGKEIIMNIDNRQESARPRSMPRNPATTDPRRDPSSKLTR
jgi:hypothetical protein